MKILPPLVVAAALLLAGCVEHETVVERRGPPPPPPPGPYGYGYGYGYGAPPPVIVESRGYAPYPGAFWVRGHWVWARGHWRWHRGYWR